jgi:hypothetical protein
MKAKYNASKVYLATDDPKIAAEARAHEKRHPGEFTFLIDQRMAVVRKRLSTNEYIEDRPELWSEKSVLGHAVGLYKLNSVDP